MGDAVSYDYDFIVIGSGFGGSVSAFRLAEKGYKVLVLEKGRWYSEDDFPRTTWNIRKYFWIPLFRCFGFFKLSFFRHVTIMSGTGVGGGSLVYANCLQIPQGEFFRTGSWAHLADWEKELQSYYQTGIRMMGSTRNPRLEIGDEILRQIGREMGKEDHFEPTNVAVYFGQPETTVSDPYFGGEGPDRSGCVFCGGCMVGCRYNAKNSLDKNYLYLAQKRGAKIQSQTKVYDVIPIDEEGRKGYRVKCKPVAAVRRKKREYSTRHLIFAGGVLGTLPLLLKLKKTHLPRISDRLGYDIRTNSESFVGVIDHKKRKVFSNGLAIGSILQVDPHSHVEPVRYSEGSGFWRLLISPLAYGSNALLRMLRLVWNLLRHPIRNLQMYFVDDWAKRTQILMFMRTLDSTLRFSRGIFGMKSTLIQGSRPTPFNPEARAIAERFAEIADGLPGVLLTETLFGRPTTAHILGGAVMGKDRKEGVIDKDNRVFGYQNMWICDGSMISANPGVNPSLTIIALTERAMSQIPARHD